ncbi:MAG: Rnf-Nqr domain containing protein, partial [Desulfobacterales bacterium]
MKLSRSKTYKAISAALWQSNPISKQILGICSALAVTVQLQTAIVMGLALTLVVALSNLIIALLRDLI